ESGATDEADDSEAQPSLMRLISRHTHHDLENERWNVYGQFTYISSWKQAFSAPYTNLNGSTNSLLPDAERSFTGSLTFYLAARIWKGGEVYLVPELISERPLSGLKGLGASIQNFELQKGGAETPTFYRSRAYLRQTFEFGGEPVKQESGQQQLGKTDTSRRLVLTAGNFSILDVFDKPMFDIDPRQGLLNIAFMTYAAYDFGADARGYAWGLTGELYWDNWAVRYGRITPPKQPNQLNIEWRLFKYFGDQIELEHDHKLHGHDGKVRLLMYRNHENIGKFSDAIAAFEADPSKNAAACTDFNYGSENAGAPDLCWVRRPNVKMGIGAYAEQEVAKDFGVFARGMFADGKTEVDAYSSTDRSLSAGALGHGTLWKRPLDVTGIAYDWAWISSPHAQYMAMGGIDGFLGDGALRQGSERAFDMFYSVNFLKALWLTGDYQHITNPGFNRDRGPVDVLAVRVHGEF
ncbi:MAG TPA: carbohydrate porin, partial [Granulicella sp.]